MRYQSKKVLLLSGGTLIVAMTLTGCGSSGAKTAGPGAASGGPTGQSSAAASSSGASSSGATSGTSSSSTAKTCSASHTAATINGKSKCLAAGQVCSAKAIGQYPRYGYVCAQSNGKFVLRRK